MSYSTIADIAQDGGLLRRVVACAWTEHIPNAAQWAADHAWPLAASPGWADAWRSARASGIERPGADESVITDGAILSAVQALRAAD